MYSRLHGEVLVGFVMFLVFLSRGRMCQCAGSYSGQASCVLTVRLVLWVNVFGKKKKNSPKSGLASLEKKAPLLSEYGFSTSHPKSRAFIPPDMMQSARLSEKTILREAVAGVIAKGSHRDPIVVACHALHVENRTRQWCGVASRGADSSPPSL